MDERHFNTIDEILQALEAYHGTKFAARTGYVGGHGDVIIAEPEHPDVEVEMLVPNGGWAIGCWGRQDFGHVDTQATAALQEVG